MSGWGSRRFSARLLCAAAAIGFAASSGHAQDLPDSTELDPSAPLDPLPELGVEWPELNGSDEPIAAPQSGGQAAEPPVAETREDGPAEQFYAYVIEGIEGAADTEALLEAFRKQSALEEGDDDPANAAQIDRRSRADAELLAELLRSEGYYDAVVEARTERAGDLIRVVLDAEPG